MSVYDGLKDAAKVLRAADKIEQYQQILTALKDMHDMQIKIGQLEDEIVELKKQRITADQLEYRDKSYWLDEDGPFCSRCFDAEGKLIRLRQQNTQRSDYDCDHCHTKNIRIFPELYKVVDPSPD